MGVNLVTRVRNFSIQNRRSRRRTTTCRTAASRRAAHKLLRFDFLSYNAGNADL